jgi:hypothetical protein
MPDGFPVLRLGILESGWLQNKGCNDGYTKEKNNDEGQGGSDDWENHQLFMFPHNRQRLCE